MFARGAGVNRIGERLLDGLGALLEGLGSGEAEGSRGGDCDGERDGSRGGRAARGAAARSRGLCASSCGGVRFLS